MPGFIIGFPRCGAILLLTTALSSAAGATAPSASTAAGDFALLHDGRRHQGPVRSCVADRCRVGSDDLAREVIAWLGLGVALDAAPPALEGGGDAVVLGDGTVVRASVVGVSAGLVVTAAGEHERAAVRWIRFAPAGGGDDKGGVVTQDGGDPPSAPGGGDRDRDRNDPPVQPPGDRPAGGGPPGGRAGDDPRPPNDPPIARCPAEAPLGGHIVEDLRSHSVTEDCTGTAELWFGLVPHDARERWPGSLYSGHQASEIVYRLRIQGCTPVRAWDGCTAPGKSASGTMRNPGPVDELGLTFYALEPSLTFEVLPDAIERRLTTPITCRNGTSAWSLQPGNGIRPHNEGDVGVPPVQPTLCFMTSDEARRRDCMLHPDRYAVVPFRGEQRSHYGASSGSFSEVTLRWDVCCGCGRPPSGPPPEMLQDPCGDFAQYVARLRLAIDQAALRRAQLKARWDRFEAEKHQAEQSYSDFKLVSNSCLGWDVAVMLGEAMLGGAGTGGVEALAPPEGAAAFAKLYTFIKAAVEEDPTVILTSFLGAAEELEVGGQAALQVNLLDIEGFTASGVMDTVSTIYDAGQLYFTAEDAAARRERLEDCTDVPLVSHLVLEGAREHLDHLEAALREVPEIGRLMTLVAQADTELVNKWHEYYSACLNYAACDGRDPAGCKPPPQ